RSRAGGRPPPTRSSGRRTGRGGRSPPGVGHGGPRAHRSRWCPRARSPPTLLRADRPLLDRRYDSSKRTAPGSRRGGVVLLRVAAEPVAREAARGEAVVEGGALEREHVGELVGDLLPGELLLERLQPRDVLLDARRQPWQDGGPLV